MTNKKKPAAKIIATKANPAPIVGKVKLHIKLVKPEPVEHLKLTDLENLVKDKL